MANMSYCRFENTLNDLRDCYNNMSSDDLNEKEFYKRKQIIELCTDIANEYRDLLEEEFVEEEDLGPEYDSAGFTEDDRIVDGQYRVIINGK